MWDGRLGTSIRTGLTSRLHLGKVWRDQTATLSVPARPRPVTVAAGVPRFRPRGGTAVRLPRLATASVVASTLLLAGLTGCTSDDGASGGGDTVVIGADLDNSSTVDIAYGRALQLRIEQENVSGRLGSKKFVLRIQDNRPDPATSLRNINSFADDPTVAAVVMGSCNDCIVEA